MDFVGTGTRLAFQDYQDAAAHIGVGVAEIRAVLEVEASGHGFFTDNRPKILFEPHVFYQQLGPGMSRDAAVIKGVAYEKWGTRPYPVSPDVRYKQLTIAMTLDLVKALRSASWGLPQIIGYNYAACGYDGVIAMVEDFKKGERQQLFAMVKLLHAWGLPEALRSHDWDSFAKKYNGPRYAVNKYQKKLRNAYEKFSEVANAAAVGAPPIDSPLMGPEFFSDEENAAFG